MFEAWLIQYGAFGLIMVGMLGGIIYLFGDNKGLRDCLTKTKARMSVVETENKNTRDDIGEIKETQLRIYDKIDELHKECIRLTK